MLFLANVCGKRHVMLAGSTSNFDHRWQSMIHEPNFVKNLM